MSYARFSDHSDVYVYADVNGYVACCGCRLGDQWDFHSAEAIVAHLHEHDDAGHKVPSDLFDLDLYPPEDFIAMCDIYLCREQKGHGGDHTPISERWGDVERHEQIRARQIAHRL